MKQQTVISLNDQQVLFLEEILEPQASSGNHQNGRTVKAIAQGILDKLNNA